MIPKTIHYVWLSGDEKPEMLKDCLSSWRSTMPDFEIKEWSIGNLPDEVLNHPFVSGAIKARKWAFATDFIRVWALYNYGGIYLDLDVYVYKSFEPFLNHKAFSCIEFNPRNFYKFIEKKEADHVRGLNIEAAVMGSEQHHEWPLRIMQEYNDLRFENTPEFCDSVIMPLIVSRISLQFGFRYVPCYQVLNQDIHIYPSDTFSSCYDPSLTGEQSYRDYGSNATRYACHLVAHSWFDDKSDSSVVFNSKRLILKFFGKKFIGKAKKLLLRDNDKSRNIIFRKI